MSDVSERCRLVLIAPATDTAEALAGQLEKALSGGDVASVVLVQRELDDKSFQDHCSAAVPVIQKAGAAALVAGDLNPLHPAGHTFEVLQGREHGLQR